MNWEKLGRILNPDILKELGISTSLVPFVENVNNEIDLIKIFFTPRDCESRSELRYFILNITTLEIVSISEKLFSYGPIGAFDDSGVVACSIVPHNGKKYVFYQGWSLSVTVPSITAIGVALMDKDDKVHRIGEGPILSRSLYEPYSCASPSVIFDEGKFKMWYASMDKWEQGSEGLKHFYDIKYAESLDGLNWNRFGKGVISYQNKVEYAFGRPNVIKENGIYKMWYCYRGNAYRIGYAESIDGINWNRMDELAGIDISEKGWDDQMIEYPTVFNVKNQRYMLYNGNEFGKTGIGLAKLV